MQELEHEYSSRLAAHQEREAGYSRRLADHEREMQRRWVVSECGRHCCACHALTNHSLFCSQYDSRQLLQREMDELRTKEAQLARKYDLENQGLRVLEGRWVTMWYVGIVVD